jgi:hypothetical protein
MSPLITLCGAVTVGVPLFLQHLLVSASDAQRLAASLASRLPRRPDEEAIVAGAQTLSLVSTASFVMTPAGFAVTYVAMSSAARLLGAYLGDPSGDPLIASADWVRRRSAQLFSGVVSQIAVRARFGRDEPDAIVRGTEHGFVEADFIVVAARPKPEWTQGTVIFSDRRYFEVQQPTERLISQRHRVLYPLKRRHDFDIVRKAVRYDLPTCAEE